MSKLSEIINRARKDSKFKTKLMNDPDTVLTNEGFKVPRGVQMHVLEETSQDHYIVIPSNELNASDLKSTVGGARTKQIARKSTGGKGLRKP